MTTIATDGKTIAADGLAVCGSERTFRNERKVVVRDRHIFAQTGTAAVFETMINWYLSGADNTWELKGISKEDTFSLIVIRPDGRLFRYSNDCLFPDEFPYPQAFGSGADYALAAMHCGRNPKEAVGVSAHFDVYTGGEIQVINIAEALGRVREAAE